MPALVLKQYELRDDSFLRTQLQEEAAEVTQSATYKNKVIDFMVAEGIEHIADLDYAARVRFEERVASEIAQNQKRYYMLAFDRIKQYAVNKEIHVMVDGKVARPPYENAVIYLAYHPNPAIQLQFRKTTKKNELAWDFTLNAPEHMKRQVYSILQYILETKNDNSYETYRKHLRGLRELYSFCVDEGIEDIELMEQPQITKFLERSIPQIEGRSKNGVLNFCQMALFMQADEINWNANVWFMERFQLQPERLDHARPVRWLSFVEVVNRKNRELLKKYIRYGLGITNLSINAIRSELVIVRKFIADLNQGDHEDICMITSEQMEAYFSAQQLKGVQAETYNKMVMAIHHFFNYLLVKNYIERIPFDAECCMKKVIPHHHNRSVPSEVWEEILEKLYAFPETTRLMFLHLYCIGLRISEVCTLKGDAYYMEDEEAWIQVYQIKMRNYKRIPIPDALYKLMKVYMKRHGIKADDYVFQNTKGGAYRTGTFRHNMLKHCEMNQIQNGEYIFRSHDYRHTIATYFYDTGVSLQSIRDYLGHDYEEMTEQYIDYMPRKIAKASEEFFSGHSLLSTMKRGEKTDG